MKMSMQKNEQKQILLMEERVMIAGECLVYCLMASPQDSSASLFRILVSGYGEHGSAEIGTDLPTAITCFHSLVKGAVTPCTLCEVVHDLLYPRMPVHMDKYG